MPQLSPKALVLPTAAPPAPRSRSRGTIADGPPAVNRRQGPRSAVARLRQSPALVRPPHRRRSGPSLPSSRAAAAGPLPATLRDAQRSRAAAAEGRGGEGRESGGWRPLG